MKLNWLIVGAGLTGVTLAERIASELNEEVILIDKRGHIGGNAHDKLNEHGHLIHPFGPHIFHTNSDKVWNYLTRFTTWRPYEHRVLAIIDGQLVPIPFNLVSIERLFAAPVATKMREILIDCYGMGARVPVLKLRESADSLLRTLGEFVYEKVFRGYTLKHWGVRLEDLDPTVSGRVPVVVSEDCRYFTDKYQAMPATGYSAMVRRMVTSPRIQVMLNTSYEEVADAWECRRVIFTGPIDEYFGSCFGALPYRSMHFDFWTAPDNIVQEAAVYNYPNGESYTRVTEFKHLTGSEAPGSTLAREYPEPYVPGKNRADYPIPSEKSHALYRAYATKAKAIEHRVLFAGRLGRYSYYNMDQAVAGALALFETQIRIDCGSGERR